MGQTLRSLFYDPLVEGRLIRPLADTWAPMAAADSASVRAAAAAKVAAAARGATATVQKDSDTAASDSTGEKAADASVAAVRKAEAEAAATDGASGGVAPSGSANGVAAAAGGAAASCKDDEEGSKKGKGPLLSLQARRSLGIAATFVASGLFHELMFSYFSNPYIWGMSNFFFVQVRGCMAGGWVLVTTAGEQTGMISKGFRALQSNPCGKFVHPMALPPHPGVSSLLCVTPVLPSSYLNCRRTSWL